MGTHQHLFYGIGIGEAMHKPIKNPEPVGIEIRLRLLNKEDARLIREVEQCAKSQEHQEPVRQLRSHKVSGLTLLLDSDAHLMGISQVWSKDPTDSWNA